MDSRQILDRLIAGFMRCRTQEGSFRDPITKIADARPAAEFGRCLIICNQKEEAKKTFDWVIQQQNANGSWKEITETAIDEENTLSTAVIVHALLEGYEATKKEVYLEAAKKGLKYVLAQEFSPGYYIKSETHYVDLLNMNAAAAACIQKMYTITKTESLKEARDRAIKNTIRYQFKDGAYPYTSAERMFPYEEHMNIRDLYYHSLTMFYVMLADPLEKKRRVALSLKKAEKWLCNHVKKRTPWRKSKVTFTVGSIGFYAYSLWILKKYQRKKEEEICLRHLAKLQKEDGLFSRYEKPKVGDALLGYIQEVIEWQHIAPARYGMATRIWRIKRRIAHDLKERRKNKTSLFYSAQIANALAEYQSYS